MFLQICAIVSWNFLSVLFYTYFPTVFLKGVCICITANYQRGSREGRGGLGGERGDLWGRVGMLLQLFWSTTSHLKAIIIMITIVIIITINIVERAGV